MVLNEFSPPAWHNIWGTAVETSKAIDYVHSIDHVHELYDTPFQLIWNVRARINPGSHVAALTTVYSRDPNSEARYYSGGKPSRHVVSTRDDWMEAAQIGKIVNYEVAFAGFHVIDGKQMIGWDKKRDQMTHDIPRCDMVFKVGGLEELHVQRCLRRMKGLLGDGSLYLYKTTNSFHIYGNELFDKERIGQWLAGLKEINRENPSVIDSKWLEMNSDLDDGSQPLRINKTKHRGYPRVYCVI